MYKPHVNEIKYYNKLCKKVWQEEGQWSPAFSQVTSQ